MPTWISRGRRLRLALNAGLVAAGLFCGPAAKAEMITHLPGADKVVALTFDACESRRPAHLDRPIADYLISQKIPFTVFVSGRFARDNVAAVTELAALDFVEIENHSMNHDNHMDRMDDAAVTREVEEADRTLFQITGRHTHYFRFPAGVYSPQGLARVESLGYKVVHWSFASGDPARSVTPDHLKEWVLLKTRPASILIFHINGRGWSTGQALPEIVSTLRRRGYRFVTLDTALK